jgi:hypothetical protein
MEEQRLVAPIQRVKIVLASDEELVRELEDTTETTTASGNISYIPAVRDQSHNTDALRCIMAAILKYAIMGDVDEFDANEFGWVDNIMGGGRQWKPPWG